MIAPQALNEVKTEVVVPAPKQTKLLGATVAGVGLITTVSAELFDCFALVERPDGTESHVFVADLSKDNVTFPSESQPYVKMTRRLGYGGCAISVLEGANWHLKIKVHCTFLREGV